MTQQAPKTVGFPQMVGLFVFAATAAIFLAALANTVLDGLGTLQEYAMAFSYLVGIVAIVAMFIDVYDLWIRGRRFNSATGRGLRMVVLVAVLGSMAATLSGGNMSLVMFLLPAIVIYYMTMRPQRGARRGSAPGRTGAPSGVSSGASKSRQRRGGKKRR